MNLPIGLRVARAARVITQAFDRALAQAGGSAAVWQVLVLVRSRQWGTQSEMAEAMGVTAATLTHHLNAMEAQGLVRRWREAREPARTARGVTAEGIALFDRLRDVVSANDRRLRSGLTDDEVEQLAALPDRLRAGVAP